MARTMMESSRSSVDFYKKYFQREYVCLQQRMLHIGGVGDGGRSSAREFENYSEVKSAKLMFGGNIQICMDV